MYSRINDYYIKVLLMLFCSTCSSFGQNDNKSGIGITAGVSYIFDWKPERVPYTGNSSLNCNCNDIISFINHPSIGFNFGPVYRHEWEHWNITIGAEINQREFKSDGIKDSVLKYSYSTKPYYKIYEQNTCIVTRASLARTVQRFELMGGFNLVLYSYTNREYTYLDETKRKEKDRDSKGLYNVLIPHFAVNYRFKIKDSQYIFLPGVGVEWIAGPIYSLSTKLTIIKMK